MARPAGWLRVAPRGAAVRLSSTLPPACAWRQRRRLPRAAPDGRAAAAGLARAVRLRRHPAARGACLARDGPLPARRQRADESRVGGGGGGGGAGGGGGGGAGGP
eukprot:2354339-Prymnesium_polylepis.1